MPKKYGSQSRLIKDLIAQFKPTQQDRIPNNQKKLVEHSNQHHILRCACDHLLFQLGHQSYTEWEIQYVCIARIIFKTIHPFIFQEYGVPKSSLTRDLRKTYPLIQNRNLTHLQKIVEVGGVSLIKVR